MQRWVPELEQFRRRLWELWDAEVTPVEPALAGGDRSVWHRELVRLRDRARCLGLWAPHLPARLGGGALGLGAAVEVLAFPRSPALMATITNCLAPDVALALLTRRHPGMGEALIEVAGGRATTAIVRCVSARPRAGRLQLDTVTGVTGAAGASRALVVADEALHLVGLAAGWRQRPLDDLAHHLDLGGDRLDRSTLWAPMRLARVRRRLDQLAEGLAEDGPGRAEARSLDALIGRSLVGFDRDGDGHADLAAAGVLVGRMGRFEDPDPRRRPDSRDASGPGG